MRSGLDAAVTPTLRGLRWLGYLTLLAFVPCLLSADAYAQVVCQDPVGRLASIEGSVDVQSGEGDWRAAQLDQGLCEGDTVRVGERSRAAVQLINDAVLRVDQNTTIRLANISGETDEVSWLDLVSGAVQSFSRRPWLIKVTTPHLKGDIDGTEFYVQAEDDRSTLIVLEGRVLVSNDKGRLAIDSGQAVTAEAGKAPVYRTLVRPRDAVQWALYYPPVFAFLGGGVNRFPAGTPAQLLEAIRHAGRGSPESAFKALDRIPDSDRDMHFSLYRAALLLSVGRVVEARVDIDQALKRYPGAGLAYALRAIIHVAQNEAGQALTDAKQADVLSDTPAAKIALSYALQANARIEAARDTLLVAVMRHPDDPLVWARLGELWLMLGDPRRALAAAAKAAAFAPDLARTQLVLGYAALTAFRNREARAAFERAIELSSADPLAHLGLGLAKISAGDLAEGRKALEVAVALDSNKALLRAYLGKAYFEEKRPPLDADQYRLAKLLDPLDPTAYLYDGIRKQTQNRPVAALRDLARSIDLNDNRAVYRSRLLLDKDRAARGASLSRAYRDLGFTQLAVNEATASIGLDPSNASAHRFLSDTYLGMRRREISRVSELLQAQLMQDININPIQPSVSETNLNIITIGGPATPGFNEFTPLFERNMAKLDVTGFGGNNDTHGGEGALTALYDRFSFSAGAFHYHSDGWRDNNELDQHIFDVFAQAAITTDLNIQVEFRRRESEEGDLAFNFDPNSFLRDKTVEREQDTARMGLRYAPTPRSTLLFSYIHAAKEDARSLSAPAFSDTDEGVDVSPFTSFVDVQADDDGDQFEGQYIYQRDWLNLVAGLAYSDVDSRSDETVSFFDSDMVLVLPPLAVSCGDRITHPRGYLYTNISIPTPVTWTLGFSYDDYEEDLLENTSVNPKFGLQWWVTKDLRLRAAAFKVLKPALVNNRTIEPTQIAGFNQFFDDVDATESWRYGGGIDWRLARDLSLGGELTWRDLDEPVFVLDENETEKVEVEERNEQHHFFYLYWTPMSRLGVTAQVVYDRYAREEGFETERNSLPERVVTVSAPIGLSYFDPSGFFAGIAGTFVHQDLERSEAATQAQGSDGFFLVDTVLGYRLPNRLGLLSFGVNNLFDTEFEYQDESYREFRAEPSTGPYFPDRVFLARFSINF